jgi:hypothetical protein
MSYHPGYERFRMAGLDDCSILQPGHLVGSRLGGTHDSFSIQNLSISWLRMFKSQVMCRVTNEHLAQLYVSDKYENFLLTLFHKRRKGDKARKIAIRVRQI